MNKLFILLTTLLFSYNMLSAEIVSSLKYDFNKITIDLVENEDSVTSSQICYNDLPQSAWEGKIQLPSQLVNYIVPTNASASSRSQELLVEPGKTWWYTNYYTPVKQNEYGFSIQEPCELDGEMWYPVKIVLMGENYNPNNGSDSDWVVNDQDITVCHVRQQGNIMYVRPQIPVPYGILYSYMYGQFFNYIKRNRDEELPFEYSLNLCPTVGETLTYGNNDCYSTWEVTDMVEELNSGINYRAYRIKYHHSMPEDCSFDLEASSSYKIIPQIGWLDPSEDFISTLFFAPGGILQAATTPFDTAPQLRYVTDANGEVIYTNIGGLKLWQMPMGIADVEVMTEKATEQWFTIDGREVNKPDNPGLYIHRQGNQVTKVNIR